MMWQRSSIASPIQPLTKLTRATEITDTELHLEVVRLTTENGLKGKFIFGG
jgi:hypothetical protein